MSNDMTIDQVNAAIAEFDERCCTHDGDGPWWMNGPNGAIDGRGWADAPPPYASNIALLWPVVGRATSAWSINTPYQCKNGNWECIVGATAAVFVAPTSTEALARAVVWVAGEMEKET